MPETLKLTGGLPSPATPAAVAAGRAAAQADQDAVALGDALSAWATAAGPPAQAAGAGDEEEEEEAAGGHPGSAVVAPAAGPAKLPPAPAAVAEMDVFDLPLLPRAPAGAPTPLVGPAGPAVPPRGDGPRPGGTLGLTGGVAPAALAPVEGGVLGRVPAARTAAVVQPGDQLRITQVDTRGREILIGDWSVQEVSVVGDVGAFIQQYLQPTYGGGEYRISKHTGKAGVFQYAGNIRLPGAPNHTGGAAGGSVGGAEPMELIKLMREERKDAREEAEARQEQAEAAAAKAAAEAEARAAMAAGGTQQLLLEVLKQRAAAPATGGGLAGLVETMMTMRMMEGMFTPPPPPQTGITVWEVQQMMQQGQQQMMAQLQAALPQMLPPPPPPVAPPPEKPPTDWGAVFAGAAALLGALVTPIVGAITSRPPPPPPPDPMQWLGPVLSAALQPRQDPSVAVLTAKMDMLMSGDQPDPLEQIERIGAILQRMKPDSADMAAALVKLVDRGPELIDATGRAVQRAFTPPVPSVVDRSGSLPAIQAAPERTVGGGSASAGAGAAPGAAPAAPVVPKPLLDLRDAVLAVPVPANGQDGPAEIQQILGLMQQTLPALMGAGEPWKQIVGHIYAASLEANVEEVRKGLIALLRAGWGSQPPEPTKGAFVRLFRAYATPAFAPGMPTVAQLIAGELRKAAGMAPLPPQGADAAAAGGAEAPVLGEPAVRKAPEAAPVRGVRPVAGNGKVNGTATALHVTGLPAEEEEEEDEDGAEEDDDDDSDDSDDEGDDDEGALA